MMLFYTVLTVLYLMVMARLANEVRDLMPQMRKEMQTIPIMLGITSVYGVLLMKAHILISCFICC